jgi:hypothetical protein
MIFNQTVDNISYRKKLLAISKMFPFRIFSLPCSRRKFHYKEGIMSVCVTFIENGVKNIFPLLKFGISDIFTSVLCPLWAK